MRRIGIFVSLIIVIVLPVLAALQQKDECLAFVSQNLAKGNGNWFTYFTFSRQKVKIAEGDTLVYDVYLDPRCPVAKGGIDVRFEGGAAALRERGYTDQNGVRAHGDGVLTQASGKWYTRRIAIGEAKGLTTEGWDLVFEGDRDGVYVQFIDNVVVEHADGTKTVIYDNGTPSVRELDGAEGYTKKPACVVVDRSKVTTGANLEPIISQVRAISERLRQLDEVRKDIDLAKKFLERNPDQHLQQHIVEATELLSNIEKNDNATEEQIQAAMHSAQNAVSHTHPAMTGYTGHLVGHAHIDLQWLWEWQEGMVASHDTFAQAVKFMNEYPGFSFSQSSSCIYEAIEEQWPDLFAKMKEKVKIGCWEVVGGRVCEADTNMISPESHARQFLYGQRYFRERFGKTAIVGWEPDTFGHTLQMPQILKLGGCNYYYFCRGGKGKPLFWWQGLDGTKVLSFDEPASGSWYNSDLSYKQFQEMLDFEKNTGSKDMLWVYGVGNHGGGPTREYIEEALSWMKDPAKPKVQFSTATQFFKKLETYDLKKIPVIDQEMNVVFDGCYTSHAEIKRANRDAEAWTTSAESVATVAALFGFQYPTATFRKSWEDICMNHHHDTLPGSGIHAPYERTKMVLGRVVAEDKDIITRALEGMTLKVTPKKGGISVMAFNPLGWTRSGWVETYLVGSGWDSGGGADPNKSVATAPDGKNYPVVLLNPHSRLARFWAADVPPFGYRVFNLNSAEPVAQSLEVRDNGLTIETDKLIVSFDSERGCVKSLVQKATKRDMAGPNGLGVMEAHYENPGGMSAWVLGRINRVDPLNATGHTVAQGPGWAEVKFEYTLPSTGGDAPPTPITQTFRVTAGSDMVTSDGWTRWNAIGGGNQPSPMLRAAFDVAAATPTVTYEIPFGALARPADRQEYPALEWADVSNSDAGISVLNDSKNGHSCQGSTLRMSIIRSSFEPDPVPNPGEHHWKYAIYPHAKDWRSAHTFQRAREFNQPLLSATVPFEARGDRPLEWSPLSITGDGALASALKMAEDGNGVIFRFFECTGAPYTGEIHTNLPMANARWVNFVEDDLGAAPANAGRIPVKLHGFEIRTVKIKGIGPSGAK